MDEVNVLEMSTRNSKVLKIPSKQYYSRIKDRNGYSESVNRRRTDNTMAK
jgi:predicted nucleic-acid-binding Zn-ribbon protein